MTSKRSKSSYTRFKTTRVFRWSLPLASRLSQGTLTQTFLSSLSCATLPASRGVETPEFQTPRTLSKRSWTFLFLSATLEKAASPQWKVAKKITKVPSFLVQTNQVSPVIGIDVFFWGLGASLQRRNIVDKMALHWPWSVWSVWSHKNPWHQILHQSLRSWLGRGFDAVLGTDNRISQFCTFLQLTTWEPSSRISCRVGRKSNLWHIHDRVDSEDFEIHKL